MDRRKWLSASQVVSQDSHAICTLVNDQYKITGSQACEKAVGQFNPRVADIQL